MSKLKKSCQKLFVEGKEYCYYNNVLISLGLSKVYILYNNFLYFGNKDLCNQKIIKIKFKNIEKMYNTFLEKIYKKYSCKTLILKFGTIYTKLQQIHLSNDEILAYGLNDVEVVKNVSYASKVADLMARKIKTLTEIAIIKDNQIFDFGFSNSDYKKLIMLLYYYSIFIFYNSRSNLSKDYENGIVEFHIFPDSLEPICTIIPNQENSTNANELYFNYNSGIGETINDDFNNSFFEEKGITFENYLNIIQSLINSLKNQGRINGRIEKIKLYDVIKEYFPPVNLEIFCRECILSKDFFESSENNLYKNNCKHRLDTVPLISIDDKYFLLNEGFLRNSKNFWNNVHSIGLTPYVITDKDKILASLEKIIGNITSTFEKDIIKIFLNINKNIKVHSNLKITDIFKSKKMEDNEWDIIAIDHDRKYIFDIEAKFLSTSMTESGLSNDLKKIIGIDSKSYKNKFEKRIKVENNNLKEFLNFCDADGTYSIIRIMVTSKVVDLNIKAETRQFFIVHYGGLEKFVLKNFYN